MAEWATGNALWETQLLLREISQTANTIRIYDVATREDLVKEMEQINRHLKQILTEYQAA